jgi:hypothetical protein
MCVPRQFVQRPTPDDQNAGGAVYLGQDGLGGDNAFQSI